jgi:hypothetical protein
MVLVRRPFAFGVGEECCVSRGRHEVVYQRISFFVVSIGGAPDRLFEDGEEQVAGIGFGSRTAHGLCVHREARSGNAQVTENGGSIFA